MRDFKKTWCHWTAVFPFVVYPAAMGLLHIPVSVAIISGAAVGFSWRTWRLAKVNL